jgi:hypothetical protein
VRSLSDALAYAQAEVKSASQNWSNQCQHFARVCVGAAAWAPSAREAFNATPAANRHSSPNPPAGAIVYYGYADKGYGHAVLSAGGGLCYSTDIKRPGRVDLVPLSLPVTQWGLPYRGWIDSTPSGPIDLTPVTAHGIDYSFARPDLKKAKAAGSEFAARYLSGGTSAKDITRPEFDALHAAGLAVVLVWENGGTAAKQGAQRGAQDAHSAVAQLSGLGLSGHPVYFAVDFDPTPEELPAVVEYVKAAAAVIGASRTGVYGGESVIKAVLDARVCQFAWQTYAWGNVWDSRAQLRQVENGVSLGGAAVDLDTAHAADFGQNMPKPPPVPKPKPKPVPMPPVKHMAVPAFKVPFGPGHKGDDVKAIQRGLGVAVDGIYGPKTRAAVVAWQKRHKALGRADAIIGPKTYKALARPV